MAEVNLPPGFQLVEESTQNGLPPGFMVENAVTEPAPQGFPTATAAIGALRAGPMVARGVGRFAANHPAAAQKIIGAGITTAASGLGAYIGGVPGAVVGASIRGVTPAQATIRRVAGRMAGETPEVASEAAKALGITNYAKEYGIKVGPNDLIPKPNPANAIEHYANSTAEKGVMRLYDEFGRVVSGPNTAPPLNTPKPQPGLVSKVGSVAGNVLGRVNGATAMMDLAQAAEPNRRDIGFLGIGASQPNPTPDELQQITARTQDSQQRVQQQQQQVREKFSSLLQSPYTPAAIRSLILAAMQ